MRELTKLNIEGPLVTVFFRLVAGLLSELRMLKIIGLEYVAKGGSQEHPPRGDYTRIRAYFLDETRGAPILSYIEVRPMIIEDKNRWIKATLNSEAWYGSSIIKEERDIEKAAEYFAERMKERGWA